MPISDNVASQLKYQVFDFFNALEIVIIDNEKNEEYLLTLSIPYYAESINERTLEITSSKQLETLNICYDKKSIMNLFINMAKKNPIKFQVEGEDIVINNYDVDITVPGVLTLNRDGNYELVVRT